MNKPCRSRIITVSLPMLCAAMMCGCANHGYSVIAATSTTIGVGLSQQPANGALDATLGYKRSEVAFVPTNRKVGDGTASTGAGAKDTGNVIMELRYSGIFSSGADSGIYQRLAVGDEAVKGSGAALLFAKDKEGNIDAQTAQQVLSVTNPSPAPAASQSPAGK